MHGRMRRLDDVMQHSCMRLKLMTLACAPPGGVTQHGATFIYDMINPESNSHAVMLQGDRQ